MTEPLLPLEPRRMARCHPFEVDYRSGWCRSCWKSVLHVRRKACHVLSCIAASPCPVHERGGVPPAEEDPA